MGQSARSANSTRRGSFVSWFTFVVGVPAGIGVLFFIEHGPWQDPLIQRYVHHAAEQAVVVLFFCCAAAHLAKLLAAMKERYAQAQQLLPAWDGKPVPVSEIGKLQQALNLAGDGAKNTFIGRRIANILHFIASRDSASDLDDQLRTLADNDAIAVDGSFAILRFMIWAMPILGFLGTVLGITEAIAGITPAQLEQGAEGISSGLTKAFDATALALSCTLVAMFLNSLVEKLEHGLIERVDTITDAELAHRFQRTQAAATGATELSGPLQMLLEKQVALWSASMEKAEQRWLQGGVQQHDKFATALLQALDAALTRFGQRIAETEKKVQERNQTLLEGVSKLAAVLKETSRDHQLGLARLTDAIGMSVEKASKIQAGEAQLLRLQETLNQNLTLLANSATFEQAVESLTAAIHLLTTRVNPTQAHGPRVLPMKPNAA
jgi:biopolymer transport protein ExbB/TolQ